MSSVNFLTGAHVNIRRGQRTGAESHDCSNDELGELSDHALTEACQPDKLLAPTMGLRLFSYIAT